MGEPILPEMMRWLWRDHPVSTDVNDAVERSFHAKKELSRNPPWALVLVVPYRSASLAVRGMDCGDHALVTRDVGRAGGSRRADALFTALYEELHRMARRELAKRGGGVPRRHHAAARCLSRHLGPRGHGVPRSQPVHGLRLARDARASSTTRAAGRRRSAAASSRSPRSAPTSPTRCPTPRELTRISDALDELATVDPRLARIVDLKFFCGFSFAEIAAMSSVSERTVQRDWEKARIYLHHVLRDAVRSPDVVFRRAVSDLSDRSAA